MEIDLEEMSQYFQNLEKKRSMGKKTQTKKFLSIEPNTHN